MINKKRVISYLRVSTVNQDIAKNRDEVLRFANKEGFVPVEFVEEIVSGRKNWKTRKIKTIIDDLEAGDKIIVPELSRLGRSTLEVLEILEVAKRKGIAIYSVKENFQLNGDEIQSMIMATMLALFSQLERTFISLRTKEALRVKKAEGMVLGRPKGPGKSKLDPYEDEIIALLKTGSTKRFVSKKFHVAEVTLWAWLKKKGIDVKPEF